MSKNLYQSIILDGDIVPSLWKHEAAIKIAGRWVALPTEDYRWVLPGLGYAAQNFIEGIGEEVNNVNHLNG